MRRRHPETIVFTAAVAVASVHAIDDAFVGRQPGVDLGQHAAAGFVSLVLAAAAVFLFPRVRPGLRAALAGILGVPALVNGALHVVHIGFEGPDHSDITGVLAAVAGVVLIGLAASIPWRGRAELASTTRSRWTARAVAAPAGALLTLGVVLPISLAILETHKPREIVGAPPSAAYRTVAFDAGDGLRLSGWYRPTRNGATVLLVHGGGGDRNGARAQARLLDRHGYGVLLYDSRGRGNSEGSPNSYGWDWERDVDGALDFLTAQPEVRDGKLGALGLSSGADTLIEVAADRDEIDAVVSDGAALRTFEDTKRIGGTGPDTPAGWLLFKAVSTMSGSSSPSKALEDLVPRIAEPLLLISAGTSEEKVANDRFARVANEPFEHWNLPDARHTGAVRSHAAAYEQRVTAFFHETLLGGTAR